MSEFKVLNEAYERLGLEKETIQRILDFKKLKYKTGYYPNHSIKKDMDFIVEAYPIPVITVNEIIDIGVDLEHVFFEFRFDKEKAVKMDFSIFSKYKFEVYGINNYLEDYYLNEDLNSICNLIKESKEDEVGVSLYISKENMDEKVIEMIDFVVDLIANK